MKNKITITLLVLIFIGCEPVDNYYFKGKIIDNNTKTALSGVKIYYYSDKYISDTTYSNSNGEFNFDGELTTGISLSNISLEITQSGYVKKNITSNSKDWDLIKNPNNKGWWITDWDYDFGTIELDPTSG